MRAGGIGGRPDGWAPDGGSRPVSGGPGHAVRLSRRAGPQPAVQWADDRGEHHARAERRGGPAGQATTRRCRRRTPRSCAPAGATASSTCRRTRWRRGPRGAAQRLAELLPGERLVIPAGHVQGARERHRLPVPARHRPHPPVRQPDQRRGARRRGRRGGALRASALLARDRRVLPRPGVRRAVGRPPPVAATRCRPRSASSAATSTTCPTRSRGSAKTRVLRGVDSRGGRPGARRRGRDDELATRALRAAAGQGRVGDRPAAGGLRHHDARLRGLACASGTASSSTASAGSRAPSSAAPGRWATTSATTRSSAAAGTRPRCTGSRTPARSRPASWCCSTWAWRRPRLYTADVTRTLPVDGTFTPLQRELYSLVLDRAAGRHRRRPARAPTFLAPHHAAMGVLAHGLEDLGLLPVLGRGGARPGQQGLRPLDAARAPATCSAWTCTTAPARAPEAYHAGRRSRRAWCSPSSPGSTSRRTTCSSPRRCAASASASRTTSWSPPTGPRTSPRRCPASPTRSRSGWAPLRP